MRLDGAFRNEHTFRDFGIGVPVGGKNHRLALPFGQSVKHGARLIAARLRLLSIEIVDELSLAGRIELGQAHAHVGDAADDFLRRVGFGDEPFCARLMARSTVPLGLNDVSISTCGGRGSARSLLVVSMPSMPGMAISINATSG